MKPDTVFFVLAVITFPFFHAAGQARQKKENDHSAPFGERKKLVLPDKTAVILNSHSSLRFAQDAKNRHIFLAGDAYFEIGPSTKPLLIHTAQLLINSADGCLRVNAYPDVAGEQADVLSGNAVVKKSYKSTLDSSAYSLGPGNMVMINRSIDLIEKETYDSTLLRQWQQDKLVLKNIGFNDLVKQIEAWFNITIQTENNVPDDLHFNAAFQSPTLQHVLSVVGAAWKFRYRIENRKVLVKFR